MRVTVFPVFLGKCLKTVVRGLMAAVLFVAVNSSANIRSGADSPQELEYGTVLYEFFQRDYFMALVEQAYAETIRNPVALGDQGQVLKGGMQISFGMPDDANNIFAVLLDKTSSELVRNRAWFYLARLYYAKGDVKSANQALSRVKGEVGSDLHLEYHYLATLIQNAGNHLGSAKTSSEKVAKSLPQYPYLLFNLAIGLLRNNDLVAAVDNLERVTKYANESEELALLSDRAKHGLAELALQKGQLEEAWVYLTGIRTEGLYSNRALLAYAWTAIKMQRFEEAIAPLVILNERSIAIPEVQEAKVLIAHLYEQLGSTRKALKSNLLAEKGFKEGIGMIEEARKVIAKRDVPREFILNMEAIMEDSDWYGTKPTVDYKKLTPFLIDLMASNIFHETLTELGDLYAIQENLRYWLNQAEEHSLILDSAANKKLDNNTREKLKLAVRLTESFADESSELRLYTLSLGKKERDRLQALLETTAEQMDLLDAKVTNLKGVDAYKQPKSYRVMVAKNHTRIEELLKRTQIQIDLLEPVMRALVNTELNKHEERMQYYSAQSRLAKARLYDTTLMSLEKAQSEVQGDEPPREGSQ